MKTKPKIEPRCYYIAPEESGLFVQGERKDESIVCEKDSLHFHNYLEIGYCYRGNGSIVIEEEAHPFHQDMFTVIPKGIVHLSEYLNPAENRWAYLFVDVEHFLTNITGEETNLTEKVSRRAESSALLMDAAEQPACAFLIRRIFEAAREREEWYAEELKCLTAALLLELSRIVPEHAKEGTKKNSFPLNPAVQYMSRHYGETIRVEELAEMCHISETHFRRCFRETFMMSPIEYLNWIRIRAACEKLKRSQISIYLIAEQCGFPTISTFNRNFVRLLGCSPRQWRSHPGQIEEIFPDYFRTVSDPERMESMQKQ